MSIDAPKPISTAESAALATGSRLTTLALINEHGVTLQPGHFFETLTPGYVRASLPLEPPVFRAMASALVDRLSRAIAGTH